MTWLLTVLAVLYVPAFAGAVAVAAGVGLAELLRRRRIDATTTELEEN